MKRPEFWDAIENEVEQAVADIAAPSFETCSQNTSLDDRLIARVATGTVPLFLMSLLVLALLGSAGDSWSLLFAPLLSLVFCWFLAPFVVGGRGVSFLSVLFCAPLVVGATVVALLLPLQLSRSYFNGTNKLVTLFVHDLQDAIESVLEPRTLLFLVLGCLLCATVVRSLLAQRPWLDMPRFHMARIVMGSLLLAAGLVVPGFAVLTSPYSQPAQDWREFTEEALRDTPAWHLPKQATDELWDPLFAEHVQRLGDNKALRKEDLEAMEPRFLEACRTRRPLSRRGLWSATRLLVDYLRSPGLSDEELAEVALFFTEYCLITRADYRADSCVDVLSSRLIPRLLDSKLDEAELNKWKLGLRRVAQVLPKDEVRELDFNTYDYLYNESRRRETVIANYDDKSDRTATKARPLKVFGREFSPSPTEIASRYEDAPLFEDWFKLRAELINLSGSERRAFFYQLRHTETDRSSYPHLQGHFIENLDSRAYYQALEPLVKAGQLIIALREAKLSAGLYPENLDGLIGREQQNRWSWLEVNGAWELRDLESETPSWTLP